MGSGYFNPRSPHGERRYCSLYIQYPTLISIHAPRTGSDGKTISRIDWAGRHFNPRSPHGERPVTVSDKSPSPLFQSTLPARGATTPPTSPMAQSQDISIHAPRTGSDNFCTSACPSASDFNPRSPHGERRYGGAMGGENGGDFNPRSPHGERQKQRSTVFSH